MQIETNSLVNSRCDVLLVLIKGIIREPKCKKDTIDDSNNRSQLVPNLAFAFAQAIQ